jgi:hypothetical protein
MEGGVMPAKKTNGAISFAEIDAKLPRQFFVRRGDIRDAFGLSEEEMSALVPGTFHPTYLSPNKARGRKKSRALFYRGQVVDVARQWSANNK